jgi:hypothetical protein
MTAIVFERRGDVYAIRFAYDPVLVALLKTVPPHARSWNPATKEWRVSVNYAGQLAADIRRLGHIVTGLDEPPGGRCSGSSWARLLFERVGASRADAVHRALTRVLHPDTPTGDKQLQQELNDARAELTANTKEAAA